MEVSLQNQTVEIPSFDGTPEKLQTYREDVLQYLMAVEMHKRYLVGPRLVQELSGIAKVLVRTKTLKDPQWLSHARGAYELLRFLEENLERPGLQDANKQPCDILLLQPREEKG